MKRLIRLLSVTLALVILAGALPVAAKSKLAKPKAPLSALAGTNVIVGYAEPSATVYIVYADHEYEGKSDKKGLYKIILSSTLKKDTSFTIWQKKNKVSSKKAAYVVETPDDTNGTFEYTGIVYIETTVGSINESRFADYDNKVVRGRAVKQAIDNFANEHAAILINNMAFQGSSTSGSLSSILASESEGLGKENLKKTSYSTIAISGNNGETESGKVNGYTTDGKSCSAVTFINYNAIIGTKSLKETTNVAQGGGSLRIQDMYFDATTNRYIYNNAFVTDSNGYVKYYLTTTPLSKKDNVQYVADSSQYQSNLIKDNTGKTVGIVFVQVPTT